MRVMTRRESENISVVAGVCCNPIRSLILFYFILFIYFFKELCASMTGINSILVPHSLSDLTPASWSGLVDQMSEPNSEMFDKFHR